MKVNQELKVKHQKLLKVTSIIIFISGLLLLIFNIYNLAPVKHKLPRLAMLIQGYQYQFLAEKLPPSSIMAKRLRAIAQALKHGKTVYSFETGQPPIMGK